MLNRRVNDKVISRFCVTGMKIHLLCPFFSISLGFQGHKAIFPDKATSQCSSLIHTYLVEKTTRSRLYLTISYDPGPPHPSVAVAGSYFAPEWNIQSLEYSCAGGLFPTAGGFFDILDQFGADAIDCVMVESESTVAMS